NFRPEKNGSYTLSFTNTEVTFSYLHLIDNLTGADIDLLETSSYTFNAKTTDYESRFKLVFATGSSTGSDTFAFYSNGNWVISNDGDAILQVIDVTGRILSSERISGSGSKAIQAAPGVYVLRLINGDNVKTQKVVVR
ncbi:MAG: T9SS type A sorting domain-containing protein, partial [Bacteroidales bacterium]|nr:T9SS type A sorting domain-containing protein [Bacteroidales bacterium]